MVFRVIIPVMDGAPRFIEAVAHHPPCLCLDVGEHVAVFLVVGVFGIRLVHRTAGIEAKRLHLAVLAPELCLHTSAHADVVVHDAVNILLLCVQVNLVGGINHVLAAPLLHIGYD